MRITKIAALAFCLAIPTAYADSEAPFQLKSTYDIGGFSSQFTITTLPGEPTFYNVSEGDTSLAVSFDADYDDADDLQVVADILLTQNGEETRYQTGFDFTDATAVTKHIGDGELLVEIAPQG